MRHLAVQVCKWIQFDVPPQHEAAFASAISELAEASSQELGCLGYEAFRCDEGAFAVLERWRDEAAFEAHRQAAHTLSFKELIASLSITKETHALRPL